MRRDSDRSRRRLARAGAADIFSIYVGKGAGIGTARKIAAIVEAEGSASQCLVDAIYTFSMRAMRGRRLAYALIAEPCEPEIDALALELRADEVEDQVALRGTGRHLPRLVRKSGVPTSAAAMSSVTKSGGSTC